MKKDLSFFLSALLIVILSLTAQAQTKTNGTSKTTTGVQSRAAEGDKVWVLINHVKADKRQQFERFVGEVFWPMASKLSAEDQRLFRQTRVLNPTKAEEDGTYSYVFIMDPMIEGGDYDINSLLKKMYGEAKAVEYGKIFDETAAREQTQYVLTQTRF